MKRADKVKAHREEALSLRRLAHCAKRSRMIPLFDVANLYHCGSYLTTFSSVLPAIIVVLHS